MSKTMRETFETWVSKAYADDQIPVLPDLGWNPDGRYDRLTAILMFAAWKAQHEFATAQAGPLREATEEMLRALVNEYREGVTPRVQYAFKRLERAYDATAQSYPEADTTKEGIAACEQLEKAVRSCFRPGAYHE